MAHTKQPKAAIERALSKHVRAANAASLVGGTVKYKDPFDTDEKKVVELRKQRDPVLGAVAINRYDFIDALFRLYDTEKAAVAHLGPACAALLARAEEAEARVAEMTKENQALRETVKEAAQIASSRSETITNLTARAEKAEEENAELRRQRSIQEKIIESSGRWNEVEATDEVPLMPISLALVEPEPSESEKLQDQLEPLPAPIESGEVGGEG